MSELAQAWCQQVREILSLRKSAPPLAGELERSQAAGDGQPLDDVTFVSRWDAARQAWLSASEEVDGQIAALQAALLNSQDPDLQLIGELGLNAVTGNFKVPLLAAIQSLTQATAETRAPVVAAARQAISGFRKHLNTSEEVAVVDDNPLDVPVRIVATLLPALDTLDKALDAAHV